MKDKHNIYRIYKMGDLRIENTQNGEYMKWGIHKMEDI